MLRQPYADRSHAGQVLADSLTTTLPPDGETVVLALPRGGIAVAAAVAERLRAPLDVLVLRRLGLPGQREVGMGAAVGVGGDVVVLRDEPLCRSAQVPGAAFDAAARRAVEEVQRQADAYHEGRGPMEVRGKVAVIVDDGLTPRRMVAAAAEAVRRQHPARVVLAVPVAPVESCTAPAAHADDVVCPCTPPRLRCVGDCYQDFTQTTDEQLRRALRERCAA